MASKELQALIATKRANPYSANQSVEELRAQSEARIDPSILPPGTQIEPVLANGVACEWTTVPGSAPDKVFYFIHGGGYYRGSVASSRSPAAEIAAATGARVLSVEYRLAPEHAFPAAMDDVLAAYRWLLSEGIAATNIVVGGISAGGGLTAALLLALKDAGEPLPAGGVPLSPWVDLSQSADSYETKSAADPIISADYLNRMAAYYLGDADVRTPLASPLFGDLSGLPPQLVQVGSFETLLDDSVEYARRLGHANSPVTLEVWDGLVHGWHGSPGLPETQAAMHQIGSFFRRVVG
jgi:epsilon-lactone hydrolase